VLARSLLPVHPSLRFTSNWACLFTLSESLNGMSLQPESQSASLYPPSPPQYTHSPNSPSSDSSKQTDLTYGRLISRTPSPTPSEAKVLDTKGLYKRPTLADLGKYLKWRYVRTCTLQSPYQSPNSTTFIQRISF
jgi:hypothetical protein